jgi:predicted N-acetyltransferase YhbS
MISIPFTLTPEAPGDSATVEHLLDLSFGLSRRTKTTYRLREGERPVPGLSFVARDDAGSVVGAISFWTLRIGDEGTPALLLGPLAVRPDLQGIGIGRALMRKGLDEARAQGHRLVVLVGDEPYYARVGFRKVPDGQLLLPGPVDPARLLYLELSGGSLDGARGLVLPPHRFSALRDTTWQTEAPRAARG